jgi:hypothetical protein
VWIGFFSFQDSTLKKIAVTGGAALTLCKVSGGQLYGASWDGDVIVFGQIDKGIMKVSDKGGEPEVVASAKPGEVMYGPQLINGGRSLLFTTTTESGPERWDNAQIVVQSLSSSERKVVIRGGSDARYLPTGHLVYARGETLLAVPFDPKSGQIQGSGSPISILEGVMRSPNPAGQPPTTHFAFSASGSLVYVPARASQGSQLSLAFVDVSGKIKDLGLPPRPYNSPRISPDGKQLAIVTDDGKDAVVWIYDLKGGTSLRRLTFGGRNDLPIWSPDSQYITFQSDRDGHRSIFRQAAAGGAAERLTTAGLGDVHQPEAWSPDGRVLIFTEINTSGHSSMWTFSRPEPKPKVLFDVPNANQVRAAFSPDGQWLAYTSTEVGARGQIFVQPFPPTGAQYQISTEGGRAPLWSPDAKQLVYNELDTNRLFAVDVRTRPAFSFGKPTPLPIGGTVQPGPSGPRNYDMTPDGKQFIVLMPASTPQTSANRQSPSRINFVVNWLEELKQRVPVK